MNVVLLEIGVQGVRLLENANAFSSCDDSLPEPSLSCGGVTVA